MKIFQPGLGAAIAGVFVTMCAGAMPAQAPATAVTKTTSAPAAMTCRRRTAPMSPGDIAFARHDLPKAESLLAEESKAPGAEGDRAHNALIRALLRDSKFDQAWQNAQAWASADPKSSWAEISVAEVRWRKGEVSESVEAIVAAAKLDNCNPRIDTDYAELLVFSGLQASAKKHLDRAHLLDPIDDDISGDWMELQPRSVKLASLTAYLAQSDFLTPEDRRSLQQWKERLSEPPSAQRCHLVSSVTSTSIPYRAMQNGPRAPTFWGLDVSFNSKPRRLEIDTGAHGLLLTKSAASALHLEVQDKGKSWGIGDDGAVTSHISRVKDIRIGALEFADCDVEILEKNPDGLTAEDGLIGGDVFSDFLLTLDFPGRVLKLDPLPATPGAGTEALSLTTGATAPDTQDTPVRDRYIDPSMKDWTKVFHSGHHLIMPVMLNDSPQRLFIVDTGAQLNLVSYQMAKQVAKVSKGSDIDLMGISGHVKQTYTTGPLNLTFAGMRQTTPGLIGMDTSALGQSMGVEIAGFLGAPILHQLTMQIDYRDDLMHFSFDPKRLQRCMPGVQVADCF